MPPLKVYVAVGHGLTPSGREDPGAIGNGWTEQTAGDRIAAAATDRLRAAGVRVLSEAYRRDPNYVGSAEAANAFDADAIVAIHHDVRTAPEGTFAYHHPGSSAGQALAQAQVDRFTHAGLPTRPAWLGPGLGFADGPVAPRNLYILRETRGAASLLEVGPIGHPTLDEDDELAERGDLVGLAVLDWAGIKPPPRRVHRAVAVTARRAPDMEWARMVGHAHGFAYVEQDGAGWVQVYPDDRTAAVDDIDYLVAIGWQASKAVRAIGDGVAIAGATERRTRMQVLELIRDGDVPRRRPWAPAGPRVDRDR
jgi:hypothetical protein